MKHICPVCGNIIKFKMKVVDGMICAACSNITPHYATETINTLKQYWLENQNRKNIFNETNVIKNFIGDSVFIDNNNQLFYIGNGKMQNPQYYYFHEVSDYSIEKVGEKMVTKSKGGIGRAIVGGALFGVAGAVVGASTSKKETQTIGGENIFKITINHPMGVMVKSVASPPLGLLTFLDKCISLNNKADVKSAVSEADEILKFKDLLDKGVITKEEFELKKQQLLGL